MELNNGDFVWHNHYGVGRIQEFQIPDPALADNGNTEYPIRFQTGEIKSFTHELLERSSRKISPGGFRAFAYLDEAAAKELLVSDPVEAITMVLQDFPGLTAKNEDFKEYLAPYLENWSEWWDTAQPKLKESPQIDTSRSKFREYGLRIDALSRAEEFYRLFRRVFSFEDKPRVYEQARRTIAEYRDGASLSEEHLQDILEYINQVINTNSLPPAVRLDAVFRLQEGKWLTDDQVARHITEIIESGFRLYQLDLYSLNRTVEFLFDIPLTEENESLLASAICASEPTIESVSGWALQRGNSNFIALLLRTGLSENIPPQLPKEQWKDLGVRLEKLGKLVSGVEIHHPIWTTVTDSFQTLTRTIATLESKDVTQLVLPLLYLARSLHARLNADRPELASQVLDSLLNKSYPRQFILGLIDAARKSETLFAFGGLLEQYLWSRSEGRNVDFLRELIRSKGSTLEQVKVLVDAATENESPTLKGRVGELICDLVRKDESTDRVLFIPHLNKLHSWEGEWSWSTTLAGLRESAYLEALERHLFDFGDMPLKNAVLRFIGSRTEELESEIAGRDQNLKQVNKRIGELEGLLLEREQVIRELRSGFGGDTAEARFNEKVRIVKELASSLAEFDRMELKMTTKSREVQAIVVRLESILAGQGVIAMEAVGSEIPFSPQKHHIVDTAKIDVGETVVVAEKGYLIRDHKDKLRLLKPALVKKGSGN